MYRLIGKRVSLIISDPWEFGTECGFGPFYGKLTDSGAEKIADVDVQRALVTLDRPINYSNTDHVSAICHLRHEGSSLADLEAGLHVSVNITLLPIEAQTFSAINDDDFRRGYAATGSLQLV
jgi:hypothetical protein